MNLFHTLFPFFLLLFLGLQSALAQQQTLRPLGSMLNPDGTLNLERGFTGSLDPAGWQLSTGTDGRPRFRPEKHSASVASVPTFPGDEYWDDRFGPPGTNGTVYAIAIRGTEVIIGGKFNAVGNILAFNIARWNSTTGIWNEIGGGVGDAVFAIAVTSTDIYIGGLFRTSERMGFVARYDSANDIFRFLGNRGVVAPQQDNLGNAPGASVTALAVHGENLYVCGDIPQVDNIKVNNIAVWNRTNDVWSAVPNVPGTDATLRVALAVAGNDLYIGGSGIIRYNIPTKKVDTLKGGVNGVVRAITLHGSDVYVGGSFTTAGGKPARNIARWDGASWSSVGSGVSATVSAITFVGQNLYAGGSFTVAGDVAANYIARWNGSAWSTLDIGVGGEKSAAVLALATNGSSLYVGGIFSVAGRITAYNIAGWDGEEWFPLVPNTSGDLNRNGTNGSVFAIAIKGNDVYVGGDFIKAGGIRANSIARYNATTGAWSALGAGITGPSPFVRAIAVKGSDLYVGGTFTTAGGISTKGIARWDGTSWSAVGGGMGGNAPYVFALAVDNNSLFVGGAFTSAGGVPAARVARWDGVGWSALGAGITADSGSPSVTALAASSGGLYVGGDFTIAGGVRANHIARWSGIGWSSLRNGMNAPVSAIAVRDSEVFAGGEFTRADTAAAHHIARWDGVAWKAMGVGASDPVRALAVDATSLFAGGEFFSVGAVAASRVARWNGNAWNYLDTVSTVGTRGVNGPVRVLAIDASGGLYIGGGFSIAGPRRANNIVYFESPIWSSLGSDPSVGLFGPVLSLAARGNDVYAGGLFTAVGGMSAGYIARWDGTTWNRLGKGVDGPVRSIVIGSAGEVYVGGEFSMAGGSTASGIAVWDGDRWSALGAGLGGPKPYAFALTAAGDWLYVGGSFSSAGGAPASRIARWNMRTKSWSSVASGVHGASFYTYVTALSAQGNDLYVGGVFTNVDGVEAGNVAHWNGTRWEGMGEGLNNAVYAIAAGPDGEVYAGGDVSATGDSSARRIARWDGSQWNNLGAGVNGDVLALAVSPNGTLFAGGDFAIAGDFATGIAGTNHIGMWDGTRWRELGRGVDNDYSIGRVAALSITDNSVWAGGNFTVAGGKPSFYIGRWSGAYLSVEDVGLNQQASAQVRVAPNPVNTSATIRFAVSARGALSRGTWQAMSLRGVPVRLSLHDALGHEVVVILDEPMTPGDHQVRFDATALSAGMYFYRLQAGERVETKAMVVLHR